jgi:hypothetical protein
LRREQRCAARATADGTRPNSSEVRTTAMDDQLDLAAFDTVMSARTGAPVVVNGGLPGEANNVPAGTLWNGAVLPMYTSPCAVPNAPCKAPDEYFSGNNEVPDKSNMTTRFGIATIQYNNTPLGDITAITGYKNFTLFEYTDQDGTAKTNNATRRRTRGWQFSQEVRSAFNVGESFNAVAGLFFLKTNYHHYQMYHHFPKCQPFHHYQPYHLYQMFQTFLMCRYFHYFPKFLHYQRWMMYQQNQLFHYFHLCQPNQ